MKIFEKNAIIKKIMIVLIVIIMTSNFIMPNYVHEKDNDDPGVKLVNAFFHLLAYLGDVGLSAMQEIMIGTDNIGNETTGFKIQYSPGMIFANTIPALDINFFSPMESKTIVNSNATDSYISDNDYDFKDIVDRMSFITSNKINDWQIMGMGNELDQNIENVLDNLRIL